jgi:hypothetical protein
MTDEAKRRHHQELLAYAESKHFVDAMREMSMEAKTIEEQDVLSATANRIVRLERDFARAEEEMKIADRNRIHFQKELENFIVIVMDQRKLIDELRKAIYQYVNHVVSREGVTFIDVDEPWAKLIIQVWDEVEKEEGGEE